MKELQKLGKWAFIGGVLVAILAGLAGTVLPVGTVAIVLVVLGLVVGFLNVEVKETTSFLIAGLVLFLLGAAGLENIPVIGVYLAPIFTNIAAFVAPAAIVVALKAVYDLAGK